MQLFTILNLIRFAAVGGLIFYLWLQLLAWHYTPLEEAADKISIQKKAIDSQDETINQLSKDIVKIISDNKVVGFEEYFKGYQDDNETIVRTSGRIIF